VRGRAVSLFKSSEEGSQKCPGMPSDGLEEDGWTTQIHGQLTGNKINKSITLRTKHILMYG
jgi:hypothetical protein